MAALTTTESVSAPREGCASNATTSGNPSQDLFQMTEHERELVPMLRDMVKDLPDPDNHLERDEDVVRFIRARPNSIDEAHNMLRNHLIWRQSERPWRLHCEACEREGWHHALRQVGFDGQGRAIVYTCFDQCSDKKGFDDGDKHMVYAIENAVKAMLHYDRQNNRIGDGKWIWMLDYAGFGIKNCSVAQSKAPLAIMQNHYPERLHKVVMLNAPWIFGTFLPLLKPFIDAKTYEKATFIRGDQDTVRASLRELLGANATLGVVDWLVTEMAENRKSPFPRTQFEFWKDHYGNGESAGANHDPRGPKEWVSEYIMKRTPLSEKAGEECYCSWPGDAYPSPQIVKELTGVSIVEHFRWREENGKM